MRAERGSVVQRLLVAVDGGGSGTRLWVLDSMARVLAIGEGGPSSVMAVGVEKAIRAVEDAADRAGLRVTNAGRQMATASPTYLEAVQSASVSGSVAIIALAIAGADREPEVTQLREGVARMFPGARVVLEHDAVGSLVAGTLGEPGVLLLAGTGSICIARGPSGEHVRAGGWGYLLDDVGSGHWLGREGIRRALRAEDGRDPATVLSTVLAEAAGVTDVTELVGPIHRGAFDRTAIARLAPLVARAAKEGDAVATVIMDEAAVGLASLVRAVIGRSPWFEGAEAVPVVAAGGLFGLGKAWSARIQSALAEQAPQACLTGWVKAPIVGAAYFALQEFYGVIPDDAMGNLQQLRTQAVESMGDAF